MKKLLVAIALLAGSGSTYASPCVDGTLADYLALGSGGCTIAGNTLAGFSATSVLTGATPIDASNVNVTAINGASGFGLDFTLATGTPNATGPLGLLDILLGYTVSGSRLIGASLGLGLSSVSGDAAITVLENICVNGSYNDFLANGPALCGGTESANLTTLSSDISSIGSDSAGFAVSSFFDVFAELIIDGGLAGNAQLSGPVSTRFSVPEPSSLALMMLAVIAVGYARSRRRPAHTALR